MENTRELAVDMLLEMIEKNKYSHLVIREVLDKYNYLDNRDKALMKRITEGTLERRIQMDYILNQFSKVPVTRMKPFIRNLLRMSVYQLLFMDQIPDSAVCNEAVKLAGKRGFRSLSGFVNGVLRNIGRNKDQIIYPHPEKEQAQYLSVIYSMPEWLVRKWIQEYGVTRAEGILKSTLEVSPVTIRLKETMTEEEQNKLLGEFIQRGIKVSPHPYLSYAWRLEETEGIRQLPGFLEGLFQVQDVSSMLVGEIAGIQAGDYVIDVCAAPGGKALHAAEQLKESGNVSARDLTAHKAQLIRDNIERMKKKNIQALVWDACILREEDKEQADVVLADLPCSGLGIIGKKADIKYHVSEEGMQKLTALQREILDVVWQYVKPGGILIYSTCTINRSENEENAHWFAENHPFTLDSLSPFLPEELKEEGKEGMLQLMPGIHETDGFFMARFRRDR